MSVRIDTYTFGRREVPADKYWGAQTEEHAISQLVKSVCQSK